MKRILAIVACMVIIFFAMTFLAKGCVISLGVRMGACAAFVVGASVLWFVEYLQSKGTLATAGSRKKSSFDWGMHYFRAFAILAIMGTHYAGAFGYTKLVRVALTSSTIFFLFISGYLCQYIDSRRRDSPLGYYRKKLLNVICPFILFSIVFGFVKGIAGFNFDFLSKILLGEVQGQYWYIPFVTGLFLVSPLICQMDNKNLILTLAISFLAFLIFPFRPGGFALAWPHTFYLYTYFSVFYIVGFVYCRFKESIDGAIKPYWYVFALFGILLLLMLWCPETLGLKCVDKGLAIALQRFMVLVCIVLGLGYLKDKKIGVLDNLAKYSFTLYFIHFGLFAQTHAVHDKLINILPLPLALSEVLVFALYVAGMLVVAMVAKTVLGKFSRSFIGS